MNTNPSAGFVESLRVVLRLVLKEIVEKKEAHRLDSSEFAQMFGEILWDRKLVKDVTFLKVIKQEMLHLGVISVYGSEQGRWTEDLQRTLETFNMLTDYAYAPMLRTFEETVQKAYVELWEADKQSRQLEESLVMELIKDSALKEVEVVRDAIRTGKLLVIPNVEEYQALGYKMDAARTYYSVLSNGMVIHFASPE